MKRIILENLNKNKKIENDFMLTIIPKPIEYKLGTFFYDFNANTTISFDNIADNLEELLQEQINNKLKELRMSSIKKVETNNQDSFELIDNLKQFQKEQGYILKVFDSKCIICSETDQGAFYGIQTLIQLMDSIENNSISLPEIYITDYPLLQIRGISDDITRGQIPTVDNAKRLIRLLSHYKMNFYFIGYETEFLANKDHPKFAENMGYLTKTEIDEIQKYAKSHFIELVPFFQVLGHYDNILSLPEYIDLAEFPGSQCLNIIDTEKVRSFLDNIIKNISDTFDSNYIHIGGDESWDFGKFKSKDIIKEKGIGKAYFDHYYWVYKKCKDYGKENIFLYHDIVAHQQDFLKNIPKDVIMFYWKYFTNNKLFYRKSKYLKNFGFRVIVSPTIFNWSRFFPDFKLSTKNILALYNYAKKNEFLGGITSQWGDYGHEDLRINHYYSYIFSACALWSYINEEYFKCALAHQFFGCKKGDLTIINILDKLTSIHKFFSKLPPNFYIKFWEHPFLRQRPKINIKKYNKMENIANNILDSLKNAQNKVQRNKDCLQYLEFSAKLVKFLAIKFKETENISKILLNPSILENKAIKTGIIKDIKSITKMLNDLKNDYEKLWLICAKRSGLDRLLKKYEIMNFYYQKKIEEINNNINWEDPNHPAKWITVSGPKKFQKPRHYRKTIIIENEFQKCYLQGIANHYMKIYVNGDYLGYVLSRNSLSYVAMDGQIKLFDITDKIRKGKNVIAIESYNFISNNEAINIYIEFIDNIKNKNKIVISDSSWIGTTNVKDNWIKNDYNDSDWKKVKIAGMSPGYNGRIIKPYLSNNIKSINTYNFGLRLTLESYLPSIFRPLIGLALKLLALE